MRTMDRSLWETRVRGGREYDATAHQFGANGGLAAMLDARYFVPFSRNSMYAPSWALYNCSAPDNRNAIKPPADILALQERYRQLLATGDAGEQQAIVKEILDEAARQFLVFGVTLPPDGYGIVKNNMVNTMPVMANSWGWPTPPARAILQGIRPAKRTGRQPFSGAGLYCLTALRGRIRSVDLVRMTCMGQTVSET